MKSLYPLQTLAGMSFVLLSPVLASLLRTFGIEESGGGNLFFSFFLGSTLGMFSISWLARFFSSRRTLQWTAFGSAASLLAFTVCPTLETAMAVIFVTGATTGILVAFPGALLANRRGEESGRDLSVLYAFFALGVTLYPLAAGYGLSLGVAWQTLFRASAALFILWIAVSAFSDIPDMGRTEGLSWTTFKAAHRAEPGLLVAAVALNILYLGAETSLVGWTIYYLQKVFPGEATIFRASRVLTYFWAAMILGRLLTGLVVKRWGSFRTLTLLITGAFVLWLGAILSPRLVLAEVLFSATGLFFSGMFPVIVTYSGRLPSRYTGLAFSAILAGGGAGGAIVQFVLGQFAEWKGIQVGMAVVVPALPVMLGIVFWLRRRGLVE